jgi:glycerol-3-phosphate dehydrogenase
VRNKLVTAAAKKLQKEEPSCFVVGGGTEGVGAITTASRLKVECILIKGISG